MKKSIGTTAALALAAGLACATAQAQTLTTTLIAPTELNLGAVDLYRVQVRNPGAATAFNVVVRMNLPAGLELQAPIPPGCSVTTEAFDIVQGVRQAKCVIPGIGGRRTRNFDLFVLAQSQPAGNPIVHRARVTQSTNALVSQASGPLTGTQYQHFSLPITPDSLWSIQYCWSGALEVPHAICLPYPQTSLDGEIRLAVGGIIDHPSMPGPSGMTWLQNSPTELRFDQAPDPANQSPGGYSNMQLINSRCFRGHGITYPVPGAPPVERTGILFCKI